jgi:glycosyltransferase involved in cell wall biosynthesis
MIQRKGIEIAAKTCNAIGKKLLIAGQGAAVDSRGYLVPTTDPDFELPPGTWEYVGYLDFESRKRVMSKAIAVFTPTLYLECFGGTHVEAMLSGAPPITTDFGVFPGTIPDHLNGIAGFRCNTLQDFIDAAVVASSCDRAEVRKYGERFLMDRVKWEFQNWFEDLYKLYESAQDKTKKGWSRIGPILPINKWDMIDKDQKANTIVKIQ